VNLGSEVANPLEVRFRLGRAPQEQKGQAAPGQCDNISFENAQVFLAIGENGLGIAPGVFGHNAVLPPRIPPFARFCFLAIYGLGGESGIAGVAHGPQEAAEAFALGLLGV
jgi:hypothetical protein